MDPAESRTAQLEADRDSPIYGPVGWVLLSGLLTSIAVMVLGLVAAAIRNGSGVSTVLPLDRELPQVGKGDPAAILDLGILLLFATPLAGVVTALVGFARERDYAFTLVSAVLLVLLVISFAVALR